MTELSFEEGKGGSGGDQIQKHSFISRAMELGIT